MCGHRLGDAMATGRAVALVSALAALASAAAGCAAPEAAPAEAGPTLWRWGVEDCAFAIAVAPVSAADLQPYLPRGFMPRPSGGAAPHEAEVHFDAYDCRGASGPDGEALGPTDYGSVYVPVLVPKELEVEGYSAYFLKTDILVPSTAVRARYQEAGFPAHAGTATLAGGPAWSVALDMEGTGFSLDGAAGPASPQQAPLPFVEYTVLADGSLARWTAQLHDASIASGQGLLEVHGGWAEAVTGRQVAASFIAGTWNLDQTTVEFPVPWPDGPGTEGSAGGLPLLTVN
jgi:hypothetical protein